MSEKINYLKLLFESGQNSESFSEKLNNFFPGLIYVYDLDNHKLRYINGKLTEVLGFSYEELKDSEDVWLHLIFKEDVDLVKKELEKFYSIKDDESLAYGCRLNHKSGHWRYFKTFGTVLRRDETGKPLSALFIANDITDQLKTEEEAKASRELFHDTEELLQFGSWSWHLVSNKLEWTKGMYDLLEISREDSAELSSYHFIQYISEEDRNRVNSITENAIKSKREFEYGCVLKTKKGKLKDVFTKAKIVCDTEGKVEKLIGITRDITDLKNLEKEQERTFRELNRSNKELEEFAYVASHDLQEPLRKISTFNERLKNKFGTALGTDGNMYLDRIISSTENMRLLIDNLLEFSRISRSSQEYVKCDLNLVMKEVISDLELKIEETNAEFKLSNLPTIEAVPLEMKQLFNNLLSNSIKFRNPDLKPIITINSDKINKTEIVNFHLPIDRQYVKIEVSDNGIGFEEEYAERIFQIFQRLHGKTEYAGSGIGLAICKKIMDNHEGYIFGKSDLGKGASFIIILPEKQIG
jgi:PAS domain S-box-containing protein